MTLTYWMMIFNSNWSSWNWWSEKTTSEDPLNKNPFWINWCVLLIMAYIFSRRICCTVQIHSFVDAKWATQNNWVTFWNWSLWIDAFGHRPWTEVHLEQFCQPKGGKEKKEEIRKQCRCCCGRTAAHRGGGGCVILTALTICFI